jgi:hypothetical protein
MLSSRSPQLRCRELPNSPEEAPFRAIFCLSVTYQTQRASEGKPSTRSQATQLPRILHLVLGHRQVSPCPSQEPHPTPVDCAVGISSVNPIVPSSEMFCQNASLRALWCFPTVLVSRFIVSGLLYTGMIQQSRRCEYGNTLLHALRTSQSTDGSRSNLRREEALWFNTGPVYLVT